MSLADSEVALFVVFVGIVLRLVERAFLFDCLERSLLSDKVQVIKYVGLH